jgi:hypothetical protein
MAPVDPDDPFFDIFSAIPLLTVTRTSSQLFTLRKYNLRVSTCDVTTPASMIP